MTEASIIFPHQLYHPHPAVRKGRHAWLVEDALYFHQFPFHKKKLILHRASMKEYSDTLVEGGIDVSYVDAANDTNPLLTCFEQMSKEGVQVIHVTECTDYLLERNLKRLAEKFGLVIHPYPSPNFINTASELRDYFRSSKNFFLTSFYVNQRKKLNLMVDHDGPWGGKWTFDTENRKKIPASISVPLTPAFDSRRSKREAADYVRNNFPSSSGEMENFNFAINHAEAENTLDHFLQERFRLFGTYQDAIVKDESFLFHSVLTPSLNIGLLRPLNVIEKTIEFAKNNNIPINSLEGFVRQILGWREYMRAVYELKGVDQRNSNYWNHSRTIPSSFWEGSTKIDPVDSVIHRLMKHSYNHHIERLMVIGNFMMLCEFDPDEIYRWFMTLYIDAYDWVMVPNVYGMSQYADGGFISTKPYISGSNYILKMSNFKKGEWAKIWDGLYWRFIIRHRELLEQNPRMKLICRQLDKMDAEKKRTHLAIAEQYLGSI